MSWFNRMPRHREPPKLVPRENSPTTEKLLEESKKAIRKKDKK